MKQCRLVVGLSTLTVVFEEGRRDSDNKGHGGDVHHGPNQRPNIITGPAQLLPFLPLLLVCSGGRTSRVWNSLSLQLSVDEELCCGTMSEEVSSSSEVINPGLDGELGLSHGRMQERELLDLLVAAKEEVLRSQGLAGESRQLLCLSHDGNHARPSSAISLIMGYLLAVLSLGMIYVLHSVSETPYKGPLPT
ncbi:hypothetical protein MLD38_004987 [Melastoma candidum]|uniref:Uncharacterized protein n=1 Tax=Melastoma candidum TaxID=119954 RepID=A0ACB9S7L2_9MYRT|nr:hypothetical protein MLD38_004987 [Melastoma candidum]